MKLGIVGLPNVGKSTLFNAITNAGAAVGKLPVLHHRAERRHGDRAGRSGWTILAELYQPKKNTPAVIEFVDIAGLVKGASKGEGLGNKFLGNIRATDAIVHVVRCFDDENVIHVEGTHRPASATSISSTSNSSWPTWRWSSAASTRRSRPRRATRSSCTRRTCSRRCSST